MASPPYNHSPPSGSPLALPRARPTLALPTGAKSRKPSVASTTSSAHPLRQTSFPPPELSLQQQHALAEDRHLTEQYSPSLEGSFGEGDGFSDNDEDLKSAISGPASSDMGGGVKKRKRPGEKRPRGRPAKAAKGDTNDDGRSAVISGKRGATVEPAAEEEDDDDDDEVGGAGGGRVPLYEGGQMTQAERDAELARRNAFYESVPEAHTARYDSFTRAKLSKNEVRKLVNATLSQSVPQNVVLVASAYAKMFAGGLIEEAREVQREWEAANIKHADGSENYAYKRIKKSQPHGQDQDSENVHPTTNGQSNGNGALKPEPTSPNGVDINMKDAKHDAKDDIPPLAPGGAGGLGRDVHEFDRGPLLPDHLREALRRYKKRRAGGPVGFTGLSLEGRENAAPRMGGRRLFR